MPETPLPTQKLGWEFFIQIIANYGLPLAERLWTKYASGNPPSAADWAELNELTYQKARDRMTKMLLDQGIDPASEQGQLFIKLASKV
jgi:hypothetical protein